MATRLPPLLDRARLLARRGARTRHGADPVSPFEAALVQGADGIHADAWQTRDGAIALHPDGVHRRFPRRRIRQVEASEIAGSITLLDELLTRIGADGSHINLRLRDVDAIDQILSMARDNGAEDRLWLVHESVDTLAEWRDRSPLVHLVNVAAVNDLPVGAERRAAELAAARIDALLLPEHEWTGGLTTLVHRFEVLGFADGANYERQIARLIDMGMDAVIGDHVDRLVAVAATFE